VKEVNKKMNELRTEFDKYYAEGGVRCLFGWCWRGACVCMPPPADAATALRQCIGVPTAPDKQQGRNAGAAAS
jgi:hypothetical protein